MAKEIAKVESIEIRDQVMELTNPWIEAGKELGRQEGEVELVLRQLNRRFGAPSDFEEKAVRNLPLEKIEALSEALLDFSSRDDFAAWLRTKA